MDVIWKTLGHKTGFSHLGEKILQLLDDETIRSIRLVSKSGRFIVDVHTDFWHRKLSKSPMQYYFSIREIRKIKRVLLENYIVDDIKAYVGVMEECRLRQKAFMDAVMELKWAQVRATNQHERQVMALDIARIKVKRTQMMDPFRVTVELEEFGFGFWKLFSAKTAFGFKWPQKGHKWICEFIRPIIVENCTIFLKQLLNNLDINEINDVW